MNRNPVFRGYDSEELPMEPDRHVLCPHYDKCLDDAIRMNRNFECGICRFKQFGIIRYPVHNGMAY